VESITLGFKGYDVHELACHFVARQSGIYRRHGLDVRLADTTFMTDADEAPLTFHAGCGAALLSWLGGADLRVVFVAAERPMFWLYAAPSVRQLADLRGSSIAGFPAYTPPAVFMRTILQRESIEPEHVTILPARDDIARMGLLFDGSVSAALLSSAVPPDTLERRGYRSLLLLGDALRVPTTGLAVAAETGVSAPERIRALCASYAEALVLIHQEPGVLEAAVGEYVAATGDGRTAMAARVRQCYTRNGRCDPALLDNAIRVIAATLNVSSVRPAKSLYDFSALDAD